MLTSASESSQGSPEYALDTGRITVSKGGKGKEDIPIPPNNLGDLGKIRIAPPLGFS